MNNGNIPTTNREDKLPPWPSYSNTMNDRRSTTPNTMKRGNGITIPSEMNPLPVLPSFVPSLRNRPPPYQPLILIPKLQIIDKNNNSNNTIHPNPNYEGNSIVEESYSPHNKSFGNPNSYYSSNNYSNYTSEGTNSTSRPPTTNSVPRRASLSARSKREVP